MCLCVQVWRQLDVCACVVRFQLCVLVCAGLEAARAFTASVQAPSGQCTLPCQIVFQAISIVEQ